MKNIHNYIAIFVLILVMSGIIIAFSTISKSDTLNTSKTEETNISKEEDFKYITSRISQNSNIQFENNFGGTNDDKIVEVFKLNNYYLIGTTKSKDKYFNKVSSDSVFVMIVDADGNVINISTISFEKDIQIISTKIHQNYIYILVNNQGTKLINYNLTSNLFDVDYFDSNSQSDLIISSEPIVAFFNGQTTSFYFVLSNAVKVYNVNITKILLSCDYLNGTLIIYNDNLSTHFALLTLSGITPLSTMQSHLTLQINITEENFVLLTTSKGNNYIKILDNNFNEKYSSTIDAGTNYNIMWTNNTHILTYTLDSALYMSCYCDHATKIYSAKLIDNVEEYKVELKTNINIVTKESNSINTYVFNVLGEQKEKNNYNFSNNADIVYFDSDYFNNLTIFGNYCYPNNVITTTFGNYDIFVTKTQK